MPSVCPGCATGCNIEVHASRGTIYRLVPRENLEVNQHWMCDEGRFEYKAVHQNRLLLPLVSGKRAPLDAAFELAAQLLREALAGDAGTVGVVFSAGATNEDTHALAQLALDGLKMGRAYAGGRALGWSDRILVSADKNPNTVGVERIVPPPLRTLKDLATDLASGSLNALLVLGNEGLAIEAGKLRSLVVLSSHKGPLVDSANVALPIAAWAECDGSFTNRHGRVQRIHAAIPSRGEAMPAWRAVAMLGRKLAVDLAYASAAEVFGDAVAKHAFMKNAVWGPPAEPVQLRFGESRG